MLKRKKLMAFFLSATMAMSCFNVGTLNASASKVDLKGQAQQVNEEVLQTTTVMQSRGRMQAAVSTPSGIESPGSENEAKEANCKITGVYFADQLDYPDAIEYIETTKNNVSIGGKCVWSFGWIAVQAKEGCKITSIKDNGGKDIATKTWGEVKSTLVSNGVKVPDKAYEDMAQISDDTVVIYITKIEYEKYLNSGNKNIVVSAEDNDKNSIDTYISFENSEKWLGNKDLNIGDKINPFEIEEFLNYYKGQDLDSENFKIQNQAYNGSDQDCLVKDENEKSVYIAKKAGEMGFLIEDKKTGVLYHIFINIVLPQDAIQADNITVDEAAKIAYESKPEIGFYRIIPKDSNVLTLRKSTIQIDLPEGITIDWENTKFRGENIVENGSKKVQYSDDFGDKKHNIEIEVKHTSSENKNIFEFSTEQALGVNNFILAVKQEDRSLEYNFQFCPNHYLYTSNASGYWVTPNQIGNIFDYIFMNGSSDEEKEKKKQQFIEDINSGKCGIDISGADYYFEDGKFTGKIIYKHPISYMNIYDNDYCISIWNTSMDVKFMASGVIVKGKNLDVSSILFNGYWEKNYDVDFGEDDNGFKYDSDTHTITAPDTIDKKEQYVYVKQWGKTIAQLKLTVCEQDKFDEELANAVSDMSKDEQMIIDVDNKDAVLSKQVVDALKNGENVKLTIKNSSSDNDVEWTFDSNKMTGELKKDIKLNVEVGKENTELKNILEENKADGLQVKFEDNGELGGEVNVKIYLSDEEKEKLNATKSINLFYYDKEKGEMILEASELELRNDSVKNKDYIEIPVTHNSEFVLSAAKELNTSEVKPTAEPTISPTAEPTIQPTQSPTTKPTAAPTQNPGTQPIIVPVQNPTASPTVEPTAVPTQSPTVEPTVVPTQNPTAEPTVAPTAEPTTEPTVMPTQSPTVEPTAMPTTTPSPTKETVVKKVKGVKVSSKNGKITFKWNKLSNVSGYQVQISTKKNFKKAKTIVAKANASSLVLKRANGKKLQKKTKYYLRIRAYKNYKNSAGIKKKVYGKYVRVSIRNK